MALDKAGLKAALQTAFEDLNSAKTASDAAQDMADAIDIYVKTAIATVTIPTGTFIVSVSGGSGAPAVGVSNPAPVPVVGDPDATTGGLS